jgi:hypothetical protein
MDVISSRVLRFARKFGFLKEKLAANERKKKRESGAIRVYSRNSQLRVFSAPSMLFNEYLRRP